MEDKKTCLYEKHIELGAKMVPFGGFIMPIQYTDIVSEHLSVREHCGLFDVSHMGEIFVSGPDAERYVQHIFTNDITDAPNGKIYYGMMLNEKGGTVDDLLVYKVDNLKYLLVVNAANIDKDYEWMLCHQSGFDVAIDNQSDVYGQIAVQGPESEKVVEEVLGIACSELMFYTFKTVVHENEELIISRTGYTGEDGFEIYGSHSYIISAWERLIDSKRATPCGLGCRDTLRFEVGLPLYGDELLDDITPLEAGLGMFVKLTKDNFIGKDALVAQKQEGLKRKIVGIELAGKAIPRHGYEVLSGEEVVGAVTTGYQSISTGKSVCMAMVQIEHTALDTPLGVKIHRKVQEGKVTKKRFYEKNYKK